MPSRGGRLDPKRLDNNPPDGSNWELLCVYCHDNEHQRELAAGDATAAPRSRDDETRATNRPFADLQTRIDKSK